MTKFCVNCGTERNESAKFCPVCGGQETRQTAQPQKDVQFPEQPHKKGKRSPVLGIVGGILVVAIAVLLILYNIGVNSRVGNLTAQNGNTSAFSVGQNSGNVYGDIQPGTWAIYWYLCGTDLESGGGKPGRGGAATMDLQEMLEVTLPDNVTVVIETGGAKKWQNDIISADARERYVYRGNELRRMESVPLASMGDPQTLVDFLGYCNENYPAEKQALILWDHGGGSLLGLLSDENFPGDLLSLPELRMALEASPAASGMYEFVGFDACLMATIDMVSVLNGQTRYMVASEELEPGIGWDYAGLFSAMARNPGLSGAELGRAICDTFYEDCEKYKVAKTVTLSVIDITKAQPLLEAYDAVGQEALLAGCEQREAYFSAFGRAALQSQNYGGGSNGRGSPYDMIDLGDLVINSADLLPENGSRLLKALEDCLVYQIKGEFCARASGLSCYYHYSSSDNFLRIFSSWATSEAFLHFYDYTMQGKLSEEGETYVAQLAEAQAAGEANTAELTPSSELNLDGLPLIPGTPLWELDIGPNWRDHISKVYAIRAYRTEDKSRIVFLGHDIDYISDPQQGYVRDNFKGAWYAIDGNLILVNAMDLQVSPDGEYAYQVFESPVMLNGVRWQLVLGIKYEKLEGGGDYEYIATRSDQYEILHARPYRENNVETVRLADREVRLLQPGDIIEPLFQTRINLGDGMLSEPEMLPYGKFTITADTKFGMELLGDGLYHTTFGLVDYAGNWHHSQVGWYWIENNEIYSATVN